MTLTRNTSKSMTKLAVLGGGFAGLCLAQELIDYYRQYKVNFELTLIDAADGAPGCSLGSTGVVNAQGIREGISELGDELYLAYQQAFIYFQEQRKRGLKGVKEVAHFHFFSEEKKRQERYGHLESSSLPLPEILRPEADKTFFADQSFIITPEIFLNELKLKLKDDPQFLLRQSFVTGINSSGEVFLSRGEKLQFDLIVVCLGAQKLRLKNHFYQDIKPPRSLKAKEVSGYALCFDDIDWGERSFVLALDQKNLIYHHDLKEVWLGGSTQTTGELCADFVSLEYQLKGFKALLNEESALSLDPTKARVRGGLREKGHQRRPFMAPLNERIFEVHGLYKNGYSLAPLATLKLRQWLESKTPPPHFY